MPIVLTKLGPAGLVPLIATIAGIQQEPLSGAREVALDLEGGAGSASFLTATQEAIGRGESFGLVLLPLAECKALLEQPDPELVPTPVENPEVTPVIDAAPEVEPDTTPAPRTRRGATSAAPATTADDAGAAS